LGNVSELRFMNVSGLSLSGSNVGGEIAATGAPRKLSADQLWDGAAGPVAGGETGGGANPAPTPEPTPEPTPDPTPTPEPDPVPGTGGTGDLLFGRSGAMTFDGSTASVIEVAPSAATQVEAATISFSFNADKVSGSQGLVSKDASGTTVNNGHFTSYIKDGTLHVRYQEDAASQTLKLSGIQANRDYDVRTSFGEGTVSLWVDGALVDSQSLDVNWLDNTEYLQIGANGWASQSGKTGFRNPFDGTISDVQITAGYNTGAAGGEAGETPDSGGDSTVAAPVVDIAPVGGDNSISQQEGSALSLSGTAQNIADGGEVRVTLVNGNAETPLGSATVSNGRWSLDGVDLGNLAAGGYTLSASASNASGTAVSEERFDVYEEAPALPSLAEVFGIEGAMEFDGSRGSVQEFAPEEALRLAEAEIAFTFNADTVSGRQGLVSRDAYGTDVNDGHFTSYINNGTLFVRFQEGREAQTFQVSGIQQDTDYDVTARFGGGEVALELNGQLIGAAEFDFDWLDNGEYLQAGANGWASQSGAAGFRDAFDGTISDLTITDTSAALSDTFLLV
jgi:hypothetical protein